jgi:hypothetical protein
MAQGLRPDAVTRFTRVSAAVELESLKLSDARRSRLATPAGISAGVIVERLHGLQVSSGGSQRPRSALHSLIQ